MSIAQKVSKMSAQTLESFLDDAGITARSEARGEARGKAKIIRSMLISNLALSDIAKFTGLPAGRTVEIENKCFFSRVKTKIFM